MPFLRPLSFLHSCRQILWSMWLVLSISEAGYSQRLSHTDSIEYQSMLELFDEAVGIENTEIINGAKYSVPFQVVGSHPFYSSSTGASGSVTFHGQPYFNLTLLYDIYLDELVLYQARATGVHGIVLYKMNVESFIIHGHLFRNYQGPKAQELAMVSGFYDVLYESDALTIVARRKKNTKVEMGVIQYQGEDQYFFIHHGTAVPFHGLKNFDPVLGAKDRTSKLRSYVQRRKLKIRKSDGDLVEAARYCDTILANRE